ncbi:UvrD-helicase domain-containing protein [uncultured Nostoc sp.]|uniref:UvrD-helicase domain-containing protein n=1 Tax=uncultured Nostoc sp. TaxID=340711 RepID=UPI00261AE552|nr:UvrD-helicase domain-containing protein [uncultured Nostoc sp.]
MDNSLQIDNIQSFVEIIGDDDDNLWRLFIGRKVSRIQEKVKYKNLKKQTKGIKYFTEGKVDALHNQKKSEVLIRIDYGNRFKVRYKIEAFVKQFNKIIPPLSHEQIIELARRKQEERRLDLERREAERREIEKREAERREIERRKQEAEKRKAEKEALLHSLKNQFEENFLNTDKFYQAQCREYIASLVDNHKCASDVEQRFLELAQTFYQSYLLHLQATGEEDFDGLMQKAAAVIASGQTVFRRKSGTGDLKCLRYILIDEYQDFSELFHRLIEAIRQQNPQAQFFCVGDDWQAINGFAGSDLRFYQNFSQFFQPSQKLNIATNYRSATSIVDIGNTLMHGLGTPARAHKTIFGTVEIADLGQFNPNLNEQKDYPGDNITPAILRLVNKTIKDGKTVVLLSRKNSLPWDVNYGRRTSRNSSLDRFIKLVHSYLPEESRKAVTISTAHKYKGLQNDVVIILDAVPSCYPLIHPDLMFSHIFGDSIEQVVDEERRLFYVALTRAVEHLFILTETKKFSPFLEELKSRKRISLLDWLDYPPLVGSIQRITVKVGNQSGKGGNGTYAIKHLLNAEGYIWRTIQWSAWCYTYPAQDFSIEQYFDNAQWIYQAAGIEVRFYDDLENMLAKYHVDRGQYIAAI